MDKLPCTLHTQHGHWLVALGKAGIACIVKMRLTSQTVTCMAPRMPFPLKVTCVLSPSSLKLPISRVPSSALPKAALAVGAD